MTAVHVADMGLGTPDSLYLHWLFTMHLILCFYSEASTFFKNFKYIDFSVKTLKTLFLFFDVDHFFFKVFIEFVTILLLFYVLVFWPRGMWDLSSPNRD